MISVVLSVCVLIYLVYVIYPSRTTPIELYCSVDSLSLEIVKKCRSLFTEAHSALHKKGKLGSFVSGAKYTPPWFLLNRHTHTLFGAYMRREPNLKIKRDLIITEDGGTLAVDWFEGCDVKEDTPTIIILHGLTGGSHESYVQHFACHAMKNGFRTVVTNYRGCAESPITSSRFYSASKTEDISVMVDYIQKTVPAAPLLAIGFSLGSILLTKYLATHEHKIKAAVSVSNPMDLFAMVDSLDKFRMNNWIYNRGLSGNLLRSVQRASVHWDSWRDTFKFNHESVLKLKSIREFDKQFTSKMFGYKDYEEYYHDAMSAKFISRIRTPMLFMNAIDDPLAPTHGIPFSLFSENKHIVLALTNWGGHVGFLQGNAFLDPAWSDKAAVEWFTTFLADCEQT